MKRLAFILPLLVILTALMIGCGKGPGADALFSEAKALQEEAKFAEATAKYESLVQQFPKSSFAAQSQFMIGFIYANELKDLDKAKVAYEAFLKNYSSSSDSGMVASARWELDNLGKDINEIKDLSLVPDVDGEADASAEGGTEQ
ncbi:tetratricopeptide repeat protein [bacterium]|nr:tetratricopeptide repeat protein [bacterium]MBU1652336.1 tetratricopeptide repeat protein [bacterium]MBU1881131.1 tetratricopeptide repeat protein [bacterium]